MRFFSKLATILMIAGIICFPATATRAGSIERTSIVRMGDQDFLLVNKTGVEIYALYVTPHNAKDWGEDILGADTLPVNEELEITFSRKEKAKLWDLRIENEHDDYIEWESLNLLKISKLTLYYKNGKATATFS